MDYMDDTIEPDDSELDGLTGAALSAVRLACQSGLRIRVGIDKGEMLFGVVDDMYRDAPRSNRALANSEGDGPTVWRVLSPFNKPKLVGAIGQVAPPEVMDLVLVNYAKKKLLKPQLLLMSELSAARALAEVLHQAFTGKSPSNQTISILKGQIKVERFSSPPAFIPENSEGKKSVDGGAHGIPEAAGTPAGGSLDEKLAGKDVPSDKPTGGGSAGSPPGDRAPDRGRDAAAERAAAKPGRQPRGTASAPVAAKAPLPRAPEIRDTPPLSLLPAVAVGYPTDIKSEIGSRIRARMIARGWSQSDLARTAGIGRDNVSSYVRGQNLPGKEMLERLAKALECTVDDLAPEIVLARQPGAAALSETPLEIRQMPGQSDVWIRMLRKVSMEQATRILAILNERPERAVAPAAPTPGAAEPAPPPKKLKIPPTPRFLKDAEQERRAKAAPPPKPTAPVKQAPAPAKAAKATSGKQPGRDTAKKASSQRVKPTRSGRR